MEYQHVEPVYEPDAMPELREALPEGLCYLDEALPGILWNARYAGNDNFVGAPVDGYEAGRIAMSTAMVAPIARAQALAQEAGYALLIWDAARPQRAVDHFARWASEPEDGLTKQTNYPNIKKADMFRLGYIAKRSGHSRGASVDLTLIDENTGVQLDMGTDFDFMDARAHHGAKGLSKDQRDNRALLARIMNSAGFSRYDNEWWHYTLKKEPFPNVYFDFAITHPEQPEIEQPEIEQPIIPAPPSIVRRP